jgi:hypothetical protein
MPYAQRSRRPVTRHLITLESLDLANRQVTAEMYRLGMWVEPLHRVGLYLRERDAGYYGWHSGTPGNIHISRLSLRDLCDADGRQTRLTDILRHEWSHAVAACFPGFVESDRFFRTFGGSYHHSWPVRSYDPAHHVTPYAAHMPSEDFAEVFNFYLRHKGRLPMRLAHKRIIVRKWRFIAAMARRMAAGLEEF